MADQRAKLKQLILDAEALMQTARSESSEIVANAERQARELVTAAKQMHAAAEAEAAELRTAAEADRRRAEVDAQRLGEDARARRTAAIEEARSVATGFGETPSHASEPDTMTATEEEVREASRKVDQMLRVARAEAKARADDLIEQARRRAAQIDEDARRREAVAAKQFRDMQRHMRDEQLEIKTRIAELRSELRSLEAEHASHEPSVEPTDERGLQSSEPVNQPQTPPRELGATGTPERPAMASPTIAPEPNEIEVPATSGFANRLQSRTDEDSAIDEGDEYARAVKRFRRRA